MFFPRLKYFARVTCILLILRAINADDGPIKESAIKTIKAGVLVFKGKQTSCALAAIDSKAAVVAATCLDEQNIDTAPDEYSVYFNDGIDGKTANYNVESITIHPEYNSTTLANNIAVLQYNSNSADKSWQNRFIVSSPDSVIGIYILHYALKDVESMTWTTPSYYFNGISLSDGCKTMSPLYKENSNTMFCSPQTFDLPNNTLSKCPVPYSIVYTRDMKDDTVCISGLYSFSAISGNSNFCSYLQQRSYFIPVGLYAGYIKQVISRGILMGVDDSPSSQAIIGYSKDPNFSMNKTSEAVSPGNFLLSGDLYINQTTDDASSTGSASNESESNDLSSEGTSASGFVENNSQDGSSHIVGIIAGTCIGAVGLASICGAIYYIRWKRKKSPGVADPMRNNDFQDMLETSRPGQTAVGNYDIHTIADYDLPPVYE
ncbi:hypothetical protein BX667DRAFT_499971, partial [Coemansia mojavensis]